MKYTKQLQKCISDIITDTWKYRKPKLLVINPVDISNIHAKVDGKDIALDFSEVTNLMPAREDDLGLDNQPGVYMFVVNQNFSLNLITFSSEVTGIFMQETMLYGKEVSVPPYNGSWVDGRWELKKDCIFYLGSTLELPKRIYEHLTSSQINNTNSLKLGFPSREIVKKHLKLYFYPCEKTLRKKIEGSIRQQYSTYFGE